jgi:hypothetical protein
MDIMKTTNATYKLSFMLVAIHAALILIVIGLSFFHWRIPDSSIGFLLMVITYYFVDLPVGLGFDKIIRPLIREINFIVWVFMELSWFVILGGIYWFCIGVIITKIRERIRPAKASGPNHN